MRLVIKSVSQAFWPANAQFVSFSLDEVEDRQSLALAIKTMFDHDALLREWSPLRRAGRFVLFPRSAGEVVPGDVFIFETSLS